MPCIVVREMFKTTFFAQLRLCSHYTILEVVRLLYSSHLSDSCVVRAERLQGVCIISYIIFQHDTVWSAKQLSVMKSYVRIGTGNGAPLRQNKSFNNRSFSLKYYTGVGAPAKALLTLVLFPECTVTCHARAPSCFFP